MNAAVELQPEAWTRLLRSRERMPHALLLHGPQGVGKLALAELFAQLLLCEKPQPAMPCGTCGWWPITASAPARASARNSVTTVGCASPRYSTGPWWT